MAGTINLAVKTTNDSSGLKAAGADLDKFGNSAAAAGGQMDAFDKKTAAASKNLSDNMVKASAVATLGIAALGAGAVMMAGQYEKSMSQVAAVSGATATELTQLKALGKDIGADTAFSARDAAAAMEELAQGGRSVAQILGGEARAAVDLAAAGNYGLAESGRTIATVMDVWKGTQLSTNDVVNRLAGAANASRFGVEDMSAAVAQAGGVAASMGVEFDDFTSAIAATASSFASGSDAGTSFKTFLLNLDGSTDKAKDKIEELGLEFRTSNGELKSMAEISQELADKVGILGEAEQTAALKVIFGNDAYRTAVGLMNQTADGVNAVNEILSNTNASDIAKQRMDNLAGSFEEFKGSAETLAISIGEKALPALTDLAGFATDAVNGFAGLPESTQQTALGAAALALSAPAAAAGLSKVAESARLLSSGAASASLKAGALGLGIGAITVAADFLLTKTTGHGLFDYLLGDVDKMDAYEEAAGGIADALYGVSDPLEKGTILTRELAAATDDFARAERELAKAMDTSKGPVGDLRDELRDWDEATEQAEEKVRALGSAMLTNGASTVELARAYDSLPEPLRKVFDEATGVEGKLAAMQQRASEGAVGVWEMADAFANWIPEVEAVAEVTPPATTALDDFRAGLEEGAKWADELGTKLDTLAGRFATLNPETAINNIHLAILKEELADVTRAGGEYSEKLGLTVDQMKDQIASLDDQNAALGENEEAYRSLMGSMEALAGPMGLVAGATLNIDEAIQGANLSSEEQITVAGQVGQALGALATGDIPKVVDALLTIGETSPEAMQEFVNGITDPAKKEAIVSHVETIAPEVGAKLRAGMKTAGEEGGAALVEGLDSTTGDAQASGTGIGQAALNGLATQTDAMYTAGFTLGQQGGQGIVAGFAAMQWAVNGAAAGLAAGGVAAAAGPAGQDSRSPSKKYEKLGRYAGEGYVEGLEASEPFVREASAQMVGAGLEGAAAATDGYGIHITAQDRHGRSPTAENGNPMGWVMGSNGAWKWVEIDPEAEIDPEKPVIYGGNDINTPPIVNVEHPLPPPPPPREITPPPKGPPNHESKPGPGGSMEIKPGTRTADGRVYWDGKGEEPSEPWVGFGALMGQTGQGKSTLLPLIPMGPNVAWDPNTGTYVTTGLQPLAPDSNVGYDPTTGELGVIDPVKANYGYSVYQDANGDWRDIVTNELAIGADGRFLTDQYRQDALGWQGRLQNDPGKFTGRGMQAPVARLSTMEAFWAKIGMNQAAGPYINDFDWFTTQEDWAQLGYGADSEWTSDPWFGFVPKEWLSTPYGQEYLGLRGIDPMNNPATTSSYNPWHPNAIGSKKTGIGTRYQDMNGNWQTAYKRVMPEDPTPKESGRHITINIQAFDTQDFIRHGAKIREAIGLDERGGY